MEGVIKLTLREKSGKITNANISVRKLKNLINKLILTTESKIDEWINEVKIYLKGAKLWIDAKNKELTYPIQHGIVVVDFQDEKIYSYQDYNNFEFLRAYDLYELIQEYDINISDTFNNAIEKEILVGIEYQHQGQEDILKINRIILKNRY